MFVHLNKREQRENAGNKHGALKPWREKEETVGEMLKGNNHTWVIKHRNVVMRPINDVAPRKPWLKEQKLSLYSIQLSKPKNL